MNLIEKMIEEKIQEAIAKGELKNLPGEGKPIVLEDDSYVPAEMRMSYKVLKNAGMVPREVTLQQEVVELKQQLDSGFLDQDQREQIQKAIGLKQIEINMGFERMQNASKK